MHQEFGAAALCVQKDKITIRRKEEKHDICQKTTTPPSPTNFNDYAAIDKRKQKNMQHRQPTVQQTRYRSGRSNCCKRCRHCANDYHNSTENKAHAVLQSSIDEFHVSDKTSEDPCHQKSDSDGNRQLRRRLFLYAERHRSTWRVLEKDRQPFVYEKRADAYQRKVEVSEQRKVRHLFVDFNKDSGY